MSLYDEYFTNDDKPFSENINDALLLSNVFDLTVGVEYPTMCINPYWGDEESVKKCSVSIVKIIDYDGVSYNSSGITGTGTVTVNFYPNFNAFGKITAIEWTNGTGITCDVYSEGGQLIQSNVPNGTITSQVSGFSVLQNFQLRFNLTNATLTKFKVTMANREDLRHGATVGITNVTGLENRLTSIESKNTQQDGTLSAYNTRMGEIESKNTAQDTAINSKAPTDHSSTGTGYGKATNTKYGHVIVDTVINSSSNNPISNSAVAAALSGSSAAGHTHGNISNTGCIGSTSGKPIITTTGGKLTTGSFGTSSGTFCQGNDSRLSDARTPTAHSHTASEVKDSSAHSTLGTSANATQATINTAIDTKISGKANSSHTHDDRYYTESEINSKFTWNTIYHDSNYTIKSDGNTVHVNYHFSSLPLNAGISFTNSSVFSSYSAYMPSYEERSDATQGLTASLGSDGVVRVANTTQHDFPSSTPLYASFTYPKK